METVGNCPSQIIELKKSDGRDANTQKDVLFDTVYNLASRISGIRLGQFVIKQIDKALWTVEKTAKWSMPVTSKSNRNKKPDSSATLVRPLPWIPFLAAVVTLRVVRAGLSVVSVMIGNESIKPSDIVHFMQSRRRKLRTIKYHGLRAMGLKTQESQDRKRRGILGIMSNMFQKVVCRPGSPYKNDSTSKRKLQKNNKKPIDEERRVDEVIYKHEDISSDYSDYSDVDNIEELLTEDPVGENNINSKKKDHEAEENLDHKKCNNLLEEAKADLVPEIRIGEDGTSELKSDEKRKDFHDSNTNSEKAITVNDPTIVKNPEMVSPKIAARINSLLAHNGKMENNQDPIDSDSASSDELNKKGSPKRDSPIENRDLDLKTQLNRKIFNNGNDNNTASNHQPQKK